MAPRYDPPTEADPGQCRPGLVALRVAMLARFPGLRYGAGTASGCYVRNGKTDGGSPSFHSRGRAVDLAGTGDTLDQAFNFLVGHADELGVIELIANGRIWTARNPTVRAYLTNPHRDHIHIALNLDGAAAMAPAFEPEAFMPALNDANQLELYAWARDLWKLQFQGVSPGGGPSLMQDALAILNRIEKLERAAAPDKIAAAVVAALPASAGGSPISTAAVADAVRTELAAALARDPG